MGWHDTKLKHVLHMKWLSFGISGYAMTSICHYLNSVFGAVTCLRSLTDWVCSGLCEYISSPYEDFCEANHLSVIKVTGTIPRHFPFHCQLMAKKKVVWNFKENTNGILKYWSSPLRREKWAETGRPSLSSLLIPHIGTQVWTIFL